MDRFAEMAKASVPNSDGPLSNSDQLQKYFSVAAISKISEPATIVDRQGKILTIYLPNILSSCWVVRSFFLGFPPHILIIKLGICELSHQGFMECTS